MAHTTHLFYIIIADFQARRRESFYFNRFLSVLVLLKKFFLYDGTPEAF